MINRKLKFCVWNIHGYNSRQIGNKFEDEEFLKCFQGIDFIGITETHVHEEVLDKMNIPGYDRLHFINEKKNAKSNTAPRGIAVFAKENISELFKLVKTENKDVIWVRMKKEKTGEDRDVYIGTCYLNPSAGVDSDRKIAKLTEDIIYFQNKGDVMVVGDFNAKTGNLDDTISPDKTDELFDLVLDEPPPKRNSEDDAVNPRGNDLLDMCRSLDLNIINGRKTGDLFGKYTCLKWNGNSLVDYLITSSSVFKKISVFEVGEFLPWLSDHCPLYFTTEISNPVPIDTQGPENRTGAPKQYVWSDESRKKFSETINSEGFQHKLDKCYELDHSDPNNLVNHITEVLTTAAEKCKIRHVKQKEQKDPPWFDKSCRELKEKIKSLGKKVRGDPKNKSLKNELFTDKKKLKKMVKNKKISFKNQLMEDMKQSKNDSKKNLETA